MQILSGIAMGVFVLTCAAVGLRLLWLAARGAGSATLYCGLGFSLIALLGFPLPAIARVGMGPVGEVNVPLAIIGSCATAAGMSCFFLFAQQVFRPGVAWAKAAAGLGIAGLVAVTLGTSVTLATAPPDADSFLVNWSWGAAIQVLCFACFGWMGVEGLLQWRMSKRRLAIGLGDRVVSNRFLMWGIFGASTTLMLVVLVALHLANIHSQSSLIGQLAMAFFGVVSSGAAALAFFPPKRWTERIARAER